MTTIADYFANQEAELAQAKAMVERIEADNEAAMTADPALRVLNEAHAAIHDAYEQAQAEAQRVFQAAKDAADRDYYAAMRAAVATYGATRADKPQ